MSALPPGQGNGPKQPPAGKPLLRKRPKVDPLVQRKRPVQGSTAPRPAGPPVGNDKPSMGLTQARNQRQQAALRQLEAQRVRNGGWSEQPPAEYQEFPLVTTKRALMEGIRHHIMRLTKNKPDKSGNTSLDVTNQDQFPRPVTLHRRDPRQTPAHKLIAKEEFDSGNPADDAEAERIRQQKLDREAQRALDQAQIAPVSKAAAEAKAKQQNNKKDKVSTFYGRNTDEQKKQSGLRYEETLPWHLEDAEGKAGVWVGSYVAGLSDVNCALVIDGANFRMIPLERFYKFDEKPKFKTFSLDDAENLMHTTKVTKRWLMVDAEKAILEKEKDETRQFLRGRARVKTESATSRAAPKTERQDDYELDMSGDEFQDDDETPGFEADDEDAKDTKSRIRREQGAANLFGEGEEEKVDEEEREQQLEKLKRKMMGKQTKKSLMKLEHAMDYDNDSDSSINNPFTDSSESESETDEKKDEDKKDEDSKKPSDAKDPSASGTASKGTSTPSGKAKGTDGSKKGKLKRPGSPNLSESSGNESTRKKIKIGKAVASTVQSRAATPLPGRPKGVGGGAMSDGEATAGEGSDGGLKLKKIKIKSGTRASGTPSGSRAGSPAPPSNTQGSISPTKGGSSTPRESPPPASQLSAPIEAWEIVAAMKTHPDGITLGNLLRKFLGRIAPTGITTKAEWIQLVKQNSDWGPDKLLRPKA
ncbi:hypothetical protein B0H67DRAFT_579701 [Lasiosphaeris hirsuta]|uniref:Transcription initiation factor IIF subunit alpha n=1 Tax=Lasiosphaeris hirsuta TaxID=260670 RepID=A0AA40AFP7_9PEZI|nr:hypothetical protein B0H67DRAFT_579701 [Lasiosphaeris hirsuta]